MIKIISYLLIIMTLLCTTVITPAFAFQYPLNEKLNFEILEIELNKSESDIDLLGTKIFLDKWIDPDIDEIAIQNAISQMVNEIEIMLPKEASSQQKLMILRKYIYDAGDWNSYRPFSYDLTDPLGTKIENKLLSTYLDTRNGNCVSMPILFLILADRLEIEATLAIAPSHIYVIAKDPVTDQYINIETTSGGHPARDSYIRTNFPMTDRAIETGIYMRPLSRREVVAMMALSFAEYYQKEKRYEDVQAVTDIILQLDLKNIDAILHSGTAWARQLDLLQEQVPYAELATQEQRSHYQFMAEQNMRAFEYADYLGWQPEGTER
ncbi:MAG: transglutaminase family protein [bacterium]